MSIVLNGTGGTISGVPGIVLQVVQSTFTGPITTTSTSFTSTGHSVSITPSSSSNKILLMLTTNFGNSSSYNTAVTIYRGASNLAFGGATPTFLDGRINGTSAYWGVGGNINYLDSPNTTSSTTYTVYYLSDTGGTAYYNTSPGVPSNSVSTLMALEIAA
jgi:hypothetical protein